LLLVGLFVVGFVCWLRLVCNFVELFGTRIFTISDVRSVQTICW